LGGLPRRRRTGSERGGRGEKEARGEDRAAGRDPRSVRAMGEAEVVGARKGARVSKTEREARGRGEWDSGMDVRLVR
jgi:hypothetical protein